MEKFLETLKGKKIDVSCGTSAAVRGDVVDVKDGILYLRDDNDNTAYVAIEKISVVWEVKDSEVRTGFVSHKK